MKSSGSMRPLMQPAFQFPMVQVAAQPRPRVLPITWQFDLTLQLPAFSSADDLQQQITRVKPAYESRTSYSPTVPPVLLPGKVHRQGPNCWFNLFLSTCVDSVEPLCLQKGRTNRRVISVGAGPAQQAHSS